MRRHELKRFLGGVILVLLLAGPAPAATLSCAIGDADCDGDVDIPGDLIPAFINHTGPGSHGKTRAEGDVHGDPWGATPNYDPHDGDVDLDDIFTMYSNFTGPITPSIPGQPLSFIDNVGTPDLVYDVTTGELLIDPDGASIDGYALGSAGDFLFANHTPALGSATSSVATELSEANFGYTGTDRFSIGEVLPAGLTSNDVSTLLTASMVVADGWYSSFDLLVCTIGDANCDGYVDISGDIFPAFENFTGPGSYGMERAQGDVQGMSQGATGNLDPHDGDVDVSDILTMFENFTGPAPPSDEAGGLVAAEALDSTIPDLIYDASTGEVLLDLDSAVGFTGYVLNSANGFITGNHTPFMAGVTTTLPYELAEATFGTPAGPYPKSIGNVFPSGMDMTALSAFLTGNQVSRGNNQPIVPFDLVIVNPVSSGVPEPAAVVMGIMALAGLGGMAVRRRRNA